jgi:hypothetical protein
MFPQARSTSDHTRTDLGSTPRGSSGSTDARTPGSGPEAGVESRSSGSSLQISEEHPSDRDGEARE